MHNALWKLIALAGVLGVGTVAVLQTNKGLQSTGEQDQFEKKDELSGGASTADPASGDAATTADGAADGAPAQGEPEIEFADAANSATGGGRDKTGIPLDLDKGDGLDKDLVTSDPFGGSAAPAAASSDPAVDDKQPRARGEGFSNTSSDPFEPNARRIASKYGNRRGRGGDGAGIPDGSQPNPLDHSAKLSATEPIPKPDDLQPKADDPAGADTFNPLAPIHDPHVAAASHETPNADGTPQDAAAAPKDDVPVLAGPQIVGPGNDAQPIGSASEESPIPGESSELKSADGSGDITVTSENPFAVNSPTASTEGVTADNPAATVEAGSGDVAPPLEDASKTEDKPATDDGVPVLSLTPDETAPNADDKTPSESPAPTLSDNGDATKPEAPADADSTPSLSSGDSPLETPAATTDTKDLGGTIPFEPLPDAKSTEAPKDSSAADTPTTDNADSATDGKTDLAAEPTPAGPQFDSVPQLEPAATPTEDKSEPAPTLESTPAAIPEPTENTIRQREPNRLPASGQPVRAIENSKDRFRGDGVVTSESPRGMQSPQITLEKVAPPSAVLGKPLVYSIIVRNVGSSPAFQVEVQDRIPKGTTLEGTIPQAELSDKRLVWRFDEIGPGREQKIAIKVTPNAEGEIGSVATVNFVSEVAAETKILAPKLELELGAPREAKLGEAVSFNFKITNRGQADATSVTIRDLIPRQLEHVGGNDLQYDVGTIPAGESREIQLSLKAVEMGKTQNRVVISADGGVSTESTAELEIVGSKLVLTRTGPAKRYVGRIAQYVTVVSNEADRPAANAKITEVVPAGMDFVEASAGGEFDASTRTITWHMDRLGPRDQRELKVKLKPAREGKQVSKISAVDALGVPTEIVATTLVEGYSSVDLKVSDAGGPVGVGEEITLKIAAHNRGTRDAQNVAVQLDLPPEVELVEVKGGKYTVKDNKIVFPSVASIAGQEQVVYEVTLKSKQEGDARVRVSLNSDGLTQPIVRDEPVLILGDQQ